MPKTKITKHIHSTILQYINSIPIAKDYDRFFKNNALFQYDCEFIHDQLTPPGRVLDLGCGTGRHLLFLESLGFETYGIDLSEHFLAASQQKLLSFGCKSPRLIHGDIMHLPLNRKSKFDCILLMFSVLGLIQGSENRAAILSSLHSHLHPGSKLIIHVHNYEFRYSTLIRKYRQLKSTIINRELKETGDKIVHNYRGIQDIYIHSFTLKEITGLLNKTGFHINALLGLNTRRDGACRGNIRKSANGFLISASPYENL